MAFKKWLSGGDRSKKKKLHNGSATASVSSQPSTTMGKDSQLANLKVNHIPSKRLSDPSSTASKTTVLESESSTFKNPFLDDSTEPRLSSHQDPIQTSVFYDSNSDNHKQVENFTESPNESVDHCFPILSTHTTDLLPYGDGSNKVFGYENFGNTCYCNSVLQCLYNLTEFRLNVLQYPARPASVQRRRRSEMPGLKPRIFNETSFCPINTSAATTNGNISKSESTTAISSSAPKEVSRKNSLMFFKDKEQTKSTSSTSSLPSGTSPQTQHLHAHTDNHHHHRQQETPLPVHTTVMAADAITEKLHEGYTRIIVGRTQGNLLSAINITNNGNVENRQASLSSSSPHTSPTPSPSNTPSGLNTPPSGPSSEQRKKAALIKGPVLNIDHSLTDYLPSSIKPNLYTSLRDIFESITENRFLIGVVSPTSFVEILKRENVLFSTMMHQDAHEFLNFLLNELSDSLQRQISDDSIITPNDNFIDRLFKGTMTNQTKCLTCDNITSRDEPFLDFPIEVNGNCETDIQEMLSDFHQKEMLNGSNKFYCDKCCGLQEAERIVGLKQLPHILALHLKRFKYSETQNCNIKLFDKIHYPLYLKVCSTFDSSICKRYELTGIVVHMGGGPHHGHYVSLCKNEKFGWLLFDDETVESVDESSVMKFCGDLHDLTTAYVLFYKEINGSDNDVNEHSEEAKAKRRMYEENIDQLIKCDDWIRRKNSSAISDQSAILEEVPEEVPESKKSSSKVGRRKSRLFSFKRGSKD